MMDIAILTGFAAGAVHVVSGADHLVSMAPSAIKEPKYAFKNSLSWGLGHSSGVIVLASLAIFIKDIAPLDKISAIAEFFVGICLLVVGIVAIRNALKLNIHNHSHTHRDGFNHQHFHMHYGDQKKHGKHNHALASLGMLHGLAGGSHLLAVFPALALPPANAIAYMVFYLFGSVSIMTIFVLAISFASSAGGKNLLSSFVGFTGGLSMVTGIYWLQTSELVKAF